MNLPPAPSPAIVEMIRKLVAYPTVSRDSNLDLIHFVRDLLLGLDAQVRLTFNDDRRKANLFATLGPSGMNGGIVLSGHTDVVPVTGQAWTSDPFTLVEREGRLFGRGTADMKSYIATALALIPEFVERGLAAPLHLALSYDEEVGCLGVGRLLTDLAAAGIRPEACVVGEPTLMHPVIAHKGKRSYRCSVKGLSAHSAYLPQGVNAVEAAAEAVTHLRGMARRHRDSGPHDHNFDVPYTTIHTGVIRGGTALNIIPSECVFDFEFRHLPGDDPAALLEEFKAYVASHVEPEMRERDPAAGFQVKQLSEIPAMDTRPETAVVALVQELTGSSRTGKVSFGTEGSQFQKAGIPTVVCGPGSIEQAHKADEYVALEQVAQCESFMRGLLERACAGPGR